MTQENDETPAQGVPAGSGASEESLEPSNKSSRERRDFLRQLAIMGLVTAGVEKIFAMGPVQNGPTCDPVDNDCAKQIGGSQGVYYYQDDKDCGKAGSNGDQDCGIRSDNVFSFGWADEDCTAAAATTDGSDRDCGIRNVAGGGYPDSDCGKSHGTTVNTDNDCGIKNSAVGYINLDADCSQTQSNSDKTCFFNDSGDEGKKPYLECGQRDNPPPGP
jgi:hypothetical protein